MIRVGFDIGGTKLAAIALDAGGRELAHMRQEVPRDYPRTLDALFGAARDLEAAHGAVLSVGIGVPGMIGAGSQLIRAVNLPWLEGTPLRSDLAAALDRPVALANDANCFGLSEAIDGAAAGATVVFGATLGTGVGGAVVIGQKPVVGVNGIAGEWGHNPMPPLGSEHGAPVRCACGRPGCVETWLNGGALGRDYRRITGRAAEGAEIVGLAGEGDPGAAAAIELYAQRLALALAGVVNLLDPEVIVLGGGLSAIGGLCQRVPDLWRPLVVAPAPRTRLVPARFGPESGLRGAAWLGAAAP